GGAVVMAEESTAWPGVTAAADQGGLGFAYKWNMGWMHDTLSYIGREPVHRGYHHDELTFGLIYAFSERFVLPLSHDEVVYGKGSLLARMPGDRWRKFANLRAYLAFMWTHPGKKLLFMGGEIGQPEEWSHDGEIRWDLLADADHAAVQRLVGDLNGLYRAEPALHASDADPDGFRWVVGDDRANSVFAYLRRAPGAADLLVVCNLTPVVRRDYRIGVSAAEWRLVLNTDGVTYAGSGVSPGDVVRADPEPRHGEARSLALTLPPLATIVLKAEG
ncbi:MAG TPA: alpha amylase C-terminal domain-containing protein, partial [Caulobacteraceae bacterium]|nr:alpha amylase C-terminal domain-containing protein [Caulobacteraceae bacterium]